MELACVTLQEHFGDPRRRAEISIDLERRMGVEQVRICAIGSQKLTEEQVRVIAILESGPEVDLPAHRPTGRLVAAQFERPSHGIEQLRRSPFGYLVSGTQAVQVRYMPVLRLGFLEVAAPLLQLPAIW